MRLIDADSLETHEIYEGEWGEWVEVINADDIDNAPTIEAIPISFIENRITELIKARNKYEIGTLPFRYHDVKSYYYGMLLEDWKHTLTELEKENRCD